MVWRQAGKFEADRHFHLALGNTRFKALSALRRTKDLELDEEDASAIEGSSDDPEVALRKCLTALTADQCAQETRRTA